MHMVIGYNIKTVKTYKVTKFFLEISGKIGINFRKFSAGNSDNFRT